MGFYDEIAKDIPWEYSHSVDAYLKVVGGKLQLPHPGWLQYHLRYLDNVIEAINAFRAGALVGLNYDISQINVTIVTDPIKGISQLKNVKTKYHEYSIDIETSNTLPDAIKNKFLCIGVGCDDTESVVFTKECFAHKAFRILFQNFLNDASKTFILQNGIFDKTRLKILEDLDIRIDEDTMLMHYCGINEHKGTHGLKEMAQLYLGFPEWEKPLDEWKRAYCKRNKVKLKDFQYSYFPQEMLAYYCGIDVAATIQLKKVFEKIMRPSSIAIYRKLVEASKYYSNMIVRGMLLDLDYWGELCNQLEDEKERLENKLDELMPGVLVTSPKQLLEWLQEEFPNDYIEGTDKFTLENLQLRYPGNEALQTILEYRKNVKILKTYVYGLYDRKDSDNIIHCEFKLHGTETGRLSSANPNMQNIPRDSSIKKLFIARKGYTLIQLDYSQAELRVLAYISGDDHLINCYVNGRDLHTEMQKKLFKDKYDEHNKDQRVIAKTINFGIPYGRTAGGMASKLKIPMSEAKQYLADWFAAAPKVKDYIKECHRMATADPQEIYYTVFGRARHYFITAGTQHHAENQSVNFPISSTANDLTIYSLCEIGKYIEDQKLDAYLVNTVHDSIVIEVKPEQAKQLALKCQEIMSTVPKKMLPGLTVPFRADAEIGDCYGDLAEPDWDGDEEEDEE